MPDYLPTQTIGTAVMRAFRQDTQSLKPGNVHHFAEGHDMGVADFEHSARVSLPWLINADLSAGERLYQAVNATREVVGCNTNLGMLLLFIPLIQAVERQQPAGTGLQNRLNNVLQTFDDVSDAERFYAAIRLAAPGGLGTSEAHDVANTASVSILAAMGAAQHRDRVAYQYISGYADIFGQAQNCLLESQKRWQSVDWALVACYLSFLSQFLDSHIVRKYGESVARDVREQSEAVLTRFITYKNPEEAVPLLLEFDTRLKAANINPGTSADLAAACMLASELDRLLVS